MTLAPEQVLPGWAPVLVPEEVELADEYLIPRRHHIDEPVAVYVLSLSSGAAYVGLSKDPAHRLGKHAQNAQLPLPGPDPAVEVTGAPSIMYLTLHGAPTQVAEIQTPSRRHAVLLEALLTDRLAHADVQVFGAGWDHLDGTKWDRNEFKGDKVDAETLAALVTA